MEDLYVKRSNGQRIIESIGIVPLGYPNQLKRPGWSGWSNGQEESSKQPTHLITRNMPARQYQHRRLCSRPKWGTRTWNAWYAMEYQEGHPAEYLAKLEKDPQWWVTPQSYAPAPPPPQSRVKTSHDRIIDAEFNRDVSQCLVVHGGRALGLERSRCKTSGLKALVEKNIAAFETQSDAIKLGCLLIAKKLNQPTEKWVGSE